MNFFKTGSSAKYFRADGLSGHLIGAFLIFLLALAFFFPILHGYTFTTVTGHQSSVYPWLAFHQEYEDYPQNDQADLNYPWHVFTKEALRKGSFPFWNPKIFAGEPFFSNGSSAVIYPPQFLANLFLPPDWAHDLLSLFHVLGSGLFMYLLLREFKAGFAGALLAAVAWMFSSFNLAWLHLEVVAPISMFLPLSVWLVTRAFRLSSWASTLGAAVSLAAALVSGHLLFCCLVYGIAVTYAFCLALRCYGSGSASMTPVQRSYLRRGTVLRLIVIIIGPVALSAVVLWPTILTLRDLGRESIPYQLVHNDIRVATRFFYQLLMPPRLPVSETTMHRMTFTGTLTALFALIGIFRRKRGAMFARVLVIAVFLVATDTLLLKLAYTVCPQFSFFSPLGRLLNLYGFGVAILGGLGLDAVGSKIPNRKIAFGLLAIVILFTAGQLVVYGRRINPPFVPRVAKNLYPETPLIRALKETRAAKGTSAGRILPLRQSQRSGWTPPVLFANEAMLFGIDSLGGYDSTAPDRSETLWRIISGQDPQAVLNWRHRRSFMSSFELDMVRFNLLPRVGVTMLVTPPGIENEAEWKAAAYAPLKLHSLYSGADGNIFSISGANCGPWLVHQAVRARSPEDALGKFLAADFDAAKSVVLEVPDIEGSWSSTASPKEATDTVVVRENGINNLSVMVTSSHAGWLVVPNSWDAGWRASVNGRKSDVLRADYAFQAVAIAPGISELQFRYRPRAFLAGAALSGLSLAAVGFGLFLCIKRRSERECPTRTEPRHEGAGRSE